jgi:uncharacterized protein DUF4412
MKTAVRVSLVLLLLRAVPALAQFEGRIDMKMTRNVEGTPREVVYSMFVRKEMLAAQAGEGGETAAKGKFIFRGDKKVMWVLNDKENTYLEIPLTDDSNGTKRHRPGKISSSVTLRKTGMKETILGYPCEEWVDQDTEKVTHIWGTSKLGNVYEGLMKSFEQLNPRLVESQMEGWEGELARMKVFPLKIVSSKDGDTTESQEVTRIERASLQESMFEPPAGYKKQTLDADMGKMMDQLQEQLKSRHGHEGDSSLNKEDLEKLMKQMQEQYERSQKDTGDSSKERE